jgi:hypothetical protein
MSNGIVAKGHGPVTSAIDNLVVGHEPICRIICLSGSMQLTAVLGRVCHRFVAIINMDGNEVAVKVRPLHHEPARSLLPLSSTLLLGNAKLTMSDI